MLVKILLSHVVLLLYTICRLFIIQFLAQKMIYITYTKMCSKCKNIKIVEKIVIKYFQLLSTLNTGNLENYFKLNEL